MIGHTGRGQSVSLARMLAYGAPLAAAAWLALVGTLVAML